jgi:hypothetical protein
MDAMSRCRRTSKHGGKTTEPASKASMTGHPVCCPGFLFDIFSNFDNSTHWSVLLFYNRIVE